MTPRHQQPQQLQPPSLQQQEARQRGRQPPSPSPPPPPPPLPLPPLPARALPRPPPQPPGARSFGALTPRCRGLGFFVYPGARFYQGEVVCTFGLVRPLLRKNVHLCAGWWNGYAADVPLDMFEFLPEGLRLRPDGTQRGAGEVVLLPETGFAEYRRPDTLGDAAEKGALMNTALLGEVADAELLVDFDPATGRWSLEVVALRAIVARSGEPRELLVRYGARFCSELTADLRRDAAIRSQRTNTNQTRQCRFGCVIQRRSQFNHYKTCLGWVAQRAREAADAAAYAVVAAASEEAVGAVPAAAAGASRRAWAPARAREAVAAAAAVAVAASFRRRRRLLGAKRTPSR
jgi:hypothetical protein